MGRTRYIEVDLRAPGLGVQKALDSAQGLLNSAGDGGWAFGHRPSDFRVVIYREFETDQAFRRALAEIRKRTGSRVYAREIPAPP